MDEKLLKEVEAMVADIFSQKEEAEQKAKTEEALQKSAETITQLTEALEAKNTESDETASQIADLQSQIEELNSKLEAAQNEAEEVAAKLTESEKTIEEMLKDKAADLRMAELEEAGVALSNRDGQKAKVREMEDEEFAAYKEELVDIRSAVQAELAKKEEEKAEEGTEEETPAEEASNEEEENKEDETASEEEQESEEASEEDDEETPPANVDTTKATAAAMNFEVRPSDDLIAKYRKLGDAMANRWRKKDK